MPSPFCLTLLFWYRLFVFAASDNSNCIFHVDGNTLNLHAFVNSSITMEYFDESTNNKYFYSPCKNRIHCHASSSQHAMILNIGKIRDYNYCGILAVWDEGFTQPYYSPNYNGTNAWTFIYKTPDVNSDISVIWHCNKSVDLHQTYIMSTSYQNEFDFVSFSMHVASKHACI